MMTRETGGRGGGGRRVCVCVCVWGGGGVCIPLFKNNEGGVKLEE